MIKEILEWGVAAIAICVTYKIITKGCVFSLTTAESARGSSYAIEECVDGKWKPTLASELTIEQARKIIDNIRKHMPESSQKYRVVLVEKFEVML